MTKKLRPLGNRLVIRKSEADKQTKGGILIPETAKKEKVVSGLVIGTGPGRSDSAYDDGLAPMHVFSGMTVVFSDYSGSKIMIEGEELCVVEESDVLGILEEEP